MREVSPEKIRKHKEQSGSDMDVRGANLASTFIKYGLVDECRLYLHAVVLGGGPPMFPESEVLDLRLVETRTFRCLRLDRHSRSLYFTNRLFNHSV